MLRIFSTFDPTHVATPKALSYVVPIKVYFLDILDIPRFQHVFLIARSHQYCYLLRAHVKQDISHCSGLLYLGDKPTKERQRYKRRSDVKQVH